MKRLLILLMSLIIWALPMMSNINIGDLKPEYSYRNIPVYVIHTGSNDGPIYTVKSSERNFTFSKVLIDGEEVMSFPEEVSECEINLGRYVYGYPNDEVTCRLQLQGKYSGETCYFTDYVVSKYGTRFIVINDTWEAVVVGYEPGTEIVRIGDEYYTTEEYSVQTFKIEKYAFENADDMRELYITSSVIQIEGEAFGECPNLEKVIFSDGASPIYLMNNSAAKRGLFSLTPLKSVYLGRNFTGQNGYYSFFPVEGCKNLEEVTFGSGSMVLHGACFMDCACLKNIVVPANVEIPKGNIEMYDYIADMGCYRNGGISGIFKNCESLETVVIESEIETMNSGMFAFCKNLTSVKLPQTVTAISPFAFKGCESLKSIPNFPNLEYIGEEAFRQCNAITNLIIPESVKTIKNHAFKYCNNLDSITITKSITDMGIGIFDDCKSIRKVYYPVDEIREYDHNMLGYNNGVPFSTLYVKPELVETAKTTIPWREFKNIQGKIFGITEVESIDLDKDNVSLFIGESTFLNINISPDDATIKKVAWSSSAPDLVSISDDGKITALQIGEADITAVTTDYTNLSVSCHVTVNPVQASSITLSAREKYLNVGESFSLTADVKPENATDKTVKWSTSNEYVATVNSDGLVVAVSSGVATIKATTTNGLTADCRVTVIQPVEGISLNMSEAILIVGDTMPLEAAVTPDYATDKTVTWSSSDESVATVSPEGLVEGKSSGEVTITATTVNGLTAECKVTVVKPAESLILSVTEATMEIGETLKIEATILPDDATYKSVSWSSSDSSIATVSAEGVVCALSSGVVTITAAMTYGPTVECKITVRFPVEGISLNMSEAILIVGDTMPLEAAVTPDYATDKTVTWSSSDESVATVSPEGLVEGKSSGEVTITATTVNGLTAECKVTVVKPAESLILSVTEATMEIGETLKIEATILPEDATYKSVSWSSSDPSVASVSADGIVEALLPGEVTITAMMTYGPTEQCQITVVPTVENISLSPSELTLPLGGTYILSVDVQPDNAADKTVAWSSSDESVATVNSEGLVETVSEGVAIITASTSNGLTAECRVVVVSLAIEPGYVNLEIGESIQLEAVVRPTDIFNPTVEWYSSNEDVAVVSASGMVTIVGEGECRIEAAISVVPIWAECHVTATSGVIFIFADGATKRDIYNVNGILLKKNATAEDFELLPPGIYIIDKIKVCKNH